MAPRASSTAVDLVPGDVLLIDAGDRISADARLDRRARAAGRPVGAHGGDSTPPAGPPLARPRGPRPPAERTNVVFAGTTATSADAARRSWSPPAWHTEFGGIAGMTQAMEPASSSPLQRELATLTRVVGVIAVSRRACCSSCWPSCSRDMPLGRGLVFALGMIVAFVPEGPAPDGHAGTGHGDPTHGPPPRPGQAALGGGSVGSTTVICTDKTGTLTTNQMTVRSVCCVDATYEPRGPATHRPARCAATARWSGRCPPTSASCCASRCWPTMPDWSPRRPSSPAGRCWGTPRRGRCSWPRPRQASTRTAAGPLPRGWTSGRSTPSASA